MNVKNILSDFLKISFLVFISLIIFHLLKKEFFFLGAYSQLIVFNIWQVLLYMNMGLLAIYFLTDIKKNKIYLAGLLLFGTFCFFIENEIIIEMYSQPYSINLIVNRLVDTSINALMQVALFVCYLFFYKSLSSNKIKNCFNYLLAVAVLLWGFRYIYFHGTTLLNVCFVLLSALSFYFALYVANKLYEVCAKKLKKSK